MAYEQSPSLKAYEQGLPSAPPPDSSTRRRWLWVLITVLAIATVALAVITFARSTAAAILAGTGTVMGKVVDESNRPLVAEIFVLHTNIEAKSNPDGTFEIYGVPAGAQSIVVAYQGAGREIIVDVLAGG
ncbi:MAG: carboxypeptidase-like regulatory domain-containing protein, partial [Anaerolineae bacterium]|nr:carboxypeptidase-like regulatory domain-containing protein [Anaerolineae bacterium]